MKTDLIGSVCVKTCGRESKRICVIVDVLDNHFVTIDGNVKRRRCNIAHLEPSGKKLEIKKGASHDEVLKVFKSAGIELKKPRPKEKQAGERPKKVRKVKEKEEKSAAKEVKKEEKSQSKEKKTETKTKESRKGF